ncbi:hypothetical protein ACJ41O_009157 [Fusarium nematophilum]
MTKTNAACWTCRLRHKKCDEVLPTCLNCDALEISCLYSDDKPEWMDSGRLQRERAQRVKVQVKRNAKQRRGRKLIRKITREIGESTTQDAPEYPSPLSVESSGLGTVPTGNSPTETGNAAEPESQTPNGISEPNPLCDALRTGAVASELASQSPAGQLTHDFLGPPFQAALPLRNEQDLRFVASYIDYIFPMLYPCYQPSFIEGGNSWLLVLALRNRESCQLITSLSTYFLSTVPVYPGPGHRICSTFTWDELQARSELAFKGMQQEVEAVSRRGVSGNLVESIRLLANIVLLLNFETITRISQSWKHHLDAAIVLFEQILSSPGLDDDIWTQPFDPGQALLGDTPKLVPQDLYKIAASSTALRFSTGLVLIADVVSSTTLGRAPRLRQHHERLLGTVDKPRMNMKYIIGCENWVLFAITDIIELDLWKKQAKTKGAFSVLELMQRATKISQNMDERLSILADSTDDDPDRSYGIDGIFSKLNLPRHQPLQPRAYNLVSSIWANATKLYLLVVLSGWQPGSDEIVELVKRNLELFRNLPSPSWLLSLSWPFCVTSCLVAKEQESIVRGIYEEIGALRNLGSVSEVMQIAEKTWEQRGRLRSEWDLGACFGSLGRMMLLI